MRISITLPRVLARYPALGNIGIVSLYSDPGGPQFDRNEVHAWLYSEMSQTQAVHTDSIDAQDPNNEGEKKAKSRRPASEITNPS